MRIAIYARVSFLLTGSASMTGAATTSASTR